MYAAQNGRKDVVEMLVAGKADPNARDREGHTALSLARSYHRQEVAEMLKKAGAPEGTSMEFIREEAGPKASPGKAGK